MMSSIINKTLNLAIESLATKNEEPCNLHSLIQALSSFQNQTSTVCKFLQQIKVSFESVSLAQKRKYLIAVIYCTQMGCNDAMVKQSIANLGGIVTTFTEQAQTFQDKKLGYLALGTLISCSSNDIVYLAVNTVLKDISSKHPELVKTSLDISSQLVTIDLVPVLLPVVEKRLQHDNYEVRIRSLRCLHCMLRLAPEFLHNTKRYVKLSLSDKNPLVMASALVCIHDIVKSDPSKYEDLPPKLTFILRQIVEGHLPIQMSHHGISAPHVQIRILRILSLITLSEETKPALGNVLLDMMNRCQSSKQNIAFAILSECIQMSLNVYKSDDVIVNTAVQYLEKFLNSAAANLLLVGMELLIKVANLKLSYCVQYQDVVLKCLQHPDTTIKKQTFTLLQALVTKENHKTLCDHMVTQLKSFSADLFVKSFGERISKIAEKFSSDLPWLLQTLHNVIEASGGNVSMTVCDKLVQCVGKASADELLHEFENCKKLLTEKISFHHFHTIALIVGAYSFKNDQSVIEIMNLVMKQTELHLAHEEKETAACVLIFVTKQLICQLQMDDDDLVTKVSRLAAPYARLSPVVYQNLAELEILQKNKEVLEVAAKGLKTFTFDDDFSFLDVYDDEEEPSSCESPQDTASALEAKLQSQPYTKQVQPMVKTKAGFMASILAQPTTPTAMGESFLSKKVPEKHPPVWNKSGYKAPANLSLNQALQNLSIVADTAEEDKAMLDIMNHVLQTSLSSSSDTDSSPSHHADEPDEKV